MNKVVILLGLASFALAGTQTQDFAAQLMAHDENPHSDRFLLCSTMPGTRQIEVTFFSLLNVAEVKNGGKANLQEKSPVTLTEHFQKVNCSMNVDDMAINIGQKKTWTILNGGDVSQKVVVPNVAFQRVGHALCDDASQTDQCMQELVQKGEEYTQEKTISEVLLSGIDVTPYKEFIAQTPQLKGEAPQFEKDTFAVLSEFKYPSKLTLNSNADTYGKIMLVDEQSELSWWKTPSSSALCTQIPGTTGEMFYGKITKDSVLHFYSEDTSSTAILTFSGEDNTHGFPALKFVLHEGMLDSAGCYCVNEKCFAPGVVDVQKYQGGLPYVMSFPHFYKADQSHVGKLQGMKPEPSQHESYFIIEPTTGMIIESSQKFQLNVNVKPLAHIDQSVGTIAEALIPLYWYSKNFKLDDVHIKAIKAMLENPAPTTTSTTVKPPTDGSSGAGDAHVAVSEQLNDIERKIQTMSCVVYTFLIIGVLVLAGFSIVQFRETKRLRSRRNSLPSYTSEVYATKAP